MEPEVEGLLGGLEQAVMEVIWSRGTATVREVHQALAPRTLAYTTVMTVMSRLATKGVLVREKRGRAFAYRSSHDGRLGFLRQRAGSEVRALLDQFGSLAIAELVDQMDEADLAELEGLVASARRVHSGDGS